MVYLAEERWWCDVGQQRATILFTAAAAFLLGEFTHYTCVAFHKAPWGGDGGDICVCKEGTEKFHNAVIIV